MSNTNLPINPLVLKWARETAGINVVELAIRMKKDKKTIMQWEAGETSPTYPQLEKLAYTILKRPLALFFFPEPPKELNPKKSFRTLPETEIENLSPYFLKLFRQAQAMQINLGELNENINPSNKKILNDIEVTKDSDYFEIADKIRSYLGISLAKQKLIKNTDEAFKIWRNRIESCGIFIFKEAFKNDQISGFCIYDLVFPIIYINNSMPKTRQVFTLFHELAHLLFKTGGIDKNNDEYLKYLPNNEKKIEIFCNKIAAETLVPNKDFQKLSNKIQISEITISALADSYCVSREVILRKFLELNFIDSEDYKFYTEKWTNQFKYKNKTSKSGGDYYATKAVYLGENYLSLAFSRYYQNKITQDQLAGYIGIKADRVLNIEPFLFKKGAVL
ncbi:MAG: hypothetical protein B6I26_02610 [Desulfobacteraceae bacterium 4572_130]|nr:MAG: hypothetical protein B6I26_02610 [Desulfobacteraceae bacterium 4572_130]